MTLNRVAIVAGARTPFAKAGTNFKNHSALDLAVHAVRGLVERSEIDPFTIDALIYGVVIHNPHIPNLAREVILRSGLPKEISAHTVSNNCITGLVAISTLYDAIANGFSEIGIAGGTESMSNPPVMFQETIAKIFRNMGFEKTLTGKLKQLLKLKPWQLTPEAPGIAEPSTGLTMGEHCELMVKQWQIPREAQDDIAYRSHMHAAQATEDGRLPQEIIPLDTINKDLLIRPNTSKEKLAKLPPVFDPSETGTITAGNASPLTDGASAVLLMSEQKAKELRLTPIAYIRAFEYSGIDPNDGLLMAPAIAVPRLLAKTGLSLNDMDIIEMHEAFAAQILCNIKAWEHGWKEPAIGKVDLNKLNPLGSSIAVGHPFAATGGRIVTTLANEMQRRDAKYGLVSICAAGAMAGAMILER